MVAIDGGISRQPVKRKISVGFIQLEELQGDTIYVQLRKDVNYIRANLISNSIFIYTNEYEHTDKGEYLEDCCVCPVSLLNEEGGIDYFLKKLEKQNHAERAEDRRMQEALILTQKLGRLEQSVSPLRSIITDLEKFTKLTP